MKKTILTSLLITSLCQGMELTRPPEKNTCFWQLPPELRSRVLTLGCTTPPISCPLSLSHPKIAHLLCLKDDPYQPFYSAIGFFKQLFDLAEFHHDKNLFALAGELFHPSLLTLSFIQSRLNHIKGTEAANWFAAGIKRKAYRHSRFAPYWHPFGKSELPEKLKIDVTGRRTDDNVVVKHRGLLRPENLVDHPQQSYLFCDLLNGHPHQDSFITTLQFSPNGDYLVSIDCSGKFCLWSTKTHRCIFEKVFTAPFHSERMIYCTFSASGQYIALSSTTALWVLKITTTELEGATARRVEEIIKHTVEQVEDSFVIVAFNQNGTRLAHARETGEIELWDSTSGHMIAKLSSAKEMRVCALMWNENDKHLYVCTHAEEIIDWMMLPAPLSRIVKPADPTALTLPDSFHYLDPTYTLISRTSIMLIQSHHHLRPTRIKSIDLQTGTTAIYQTDAGSPSHIAKILCSDTELFLAQAFSTKPFEKQADNIRIIPLHADAESVAFSPADKWFPYASTYTEPQQAPALLSDIQTAQNGIVAIAVTPNVTNGCTNHEYQVHVYDAHTATLLAIFTRSGPERDFVQGLTQPQHIFALSPRGNMVAIALANDTTIELWRSGTLPELLQLELPTCKNAQQLLEHCQEKYAETHAVSTGAPAH